MKDLHIKSTRNTPRVDFLSQGKLTLSGSVYSENAIEFFDPIIEWVKQLQAEEVTFDLIIEYINTASSKKLFELLHNLKQNNSIKTLRIHWFYQQGDEDGLETGQLLEESLSNIHFDYIEYDKKK